MHLLHAALFGIPIKDQQFEIEEVITLEKCNKQHIGLLLMFKNATNSTLTLSSLDYAMKLCFQKFTDYFNLFARKNRFDRGLVVI